MTNKQAIGAKIDILYTKIAKWIGETGTFHTEISGLRLARRNEPNKMEHCFYKPVFSVTLQGAKRIAYGEDEFLLKPGICSLVTVDIPGSSYVLEASPENPYFAMTIELDNNLITQLLTEVAAPVKLDDAPKSAVTTEVEEDVLDIYMRLADLLDNPAQIPILAPLFMKEAHFRILTGPLGNHLRMVNVMGTQTNQVAQAIAWLKGNFTAPLKVEALARQVNMGVSTFHRHFKQLTTLSPLQYQKNLRLHEAQRLMLAESYDATNAGYAVGYENVAQFNREYKRLFGEPPLRDIKRLQH